MASSLLGLAPGGGYLAIHITADAGGLLHHLFTITTLTPTPFSLGTEVLRAEGARDQRAVCFCGPHPAG
jgi:hypothetical protein